MITLESPYGLGNRILGLASTYTLARECGLSMTMLWDIDNNLGVSFDELFERPEHLDIINTTRLSIKRAPFRRIKTNCIRRKIKMNATTYLTCSSINSIRGFENGYEVLKSIFLNKENVFLESYVTFLPQEKMISENFAFLKPSKYICEVGKTLFDRIDGDTIGIHIRRTDHIEARENSPTYLFLDKMRELIKEQNKKFFLATDDKEIENEIINEFGAERVIVNSVKEFSRATAKGAIGAYLDMLALSKCDEIYGSYGSTFCLVASLLGNTKLTIMKKS